MNQLFHFLLFLDNGSTIFCLLYQFPAAAVTNYHKLGDLKQQIYSFTVLKTRSPKSKCQQSCSPSRGSNGESFLLLSSGCAQHLLASLGCGHTTTFSTSVFTLLYPLCVPSPLGVYRINLEPIQVLQDDLISRSLNYLYL